MKTKQQLKTLTLICLLSLSPPVVGGVGQVSIDVSDFSRLTYDGKRVTRMVSGRAMAPALVRALDCLRFHKATDTLRTYHGIINKRLIRGTKRKSMHWWGRAIDINADRPQPEIVVNCFKTAGFTWGGDWQGATYDPMHFTWGWRHK